MSAEEHEEGIPGVELSAREREQVDIDTRHEERYEEEARISRLLEDELHEDVMNAEDRRDQSRSFYQATVKQLEPHIRKSLMFFTVARHNHQFKSRSRFISSIIPC